MTIWHVFGTAAGNSSKSSSDLRWNLLPPAGFEPADRQASRVHDLNPPWVECGTARLALQCRPPRPRWPREGALGVRRGVRRPGDSTARHHARGSTSARRPVAAIRRVDGLRDCPVLAKCRDWYESLPPSVSEPPRPTGLGGQASPAERIRVSTGQTPASAVRTPASAGRTRASRGRTRASAGRTRAFAGRTR